MSTGKGRAEPLVVVCMRDRYRVYADAQGCLRHENGARSGYRVAGDRCDSAQFIVRREFEATAEEAAAVLKAGIQTGQ